MYLKSPIYNKVYDDWEGSDGAEFVVEYIPDEAADFFVSHPSQEFDVLGDLASVRFGRTCEFVVHHHCISLFHFYFTYFTQF